jgi:nucleoside-diphosphate-sugar epimerase
MTVMITGAGMVGTQAARILLEKGESPVLFDIAPSLDNIERIVGLSKIKLVRGDIMEPFEIMETIQSEKVDRIIHTATLFGLTQGTQQRPYLGIKVNIMGTANVLEAARLLSVKRVVFTSSGQVHSRSSTARGGEPRSPFFYATAKYAAEQLGLNYMDNCSLDFVALRLNTVFGPWRGPISGGAGKLFEELTDKALSGKPEVLEEKAAWPIALRRAMTFTYSKDAAQAAILAAYAENPRQRVYDINMGKSYGLAQIVALLNKAHPSSQLTVKEGGIEERPPMSTDISRAQQELGFQPEFEMEDALKDYLSWLQAN